MPCCTHEFSKRKHRYLPVCPRSMSGTSPTCLQQQLTEDAQKIFCQFVQKRCKEKGKEKNKNKVNCKAFYVTCKHNKQRKGITVGEISIIKLNDFC